MRLLRDELLTVINYQARLANRLEPEVESSCGPARQQTLLIQPAHAGLTRINTVFVDGPVRLANIEVYNGRIHAE